MSITHPDRLDILAYWWLPNDPERRIPGRLTWDPDEGGDLQLMGELREPVILDNHFPNGDVQKYREDVVPLERHYPVIHGSHTTKAGREEAYTLLQSLSLNNIGFHALEEYPEHISARAVLHGVWYSDAAAIEADRAIFDLSQLSSWVDTSGLDTTFPRIHGNLDGPYAVITAHQLPSFSTTHQDAVVELHQRLTPTGDHEHSSGIDESWRLHIKIEPMGELDRFSDIATDIRALVAIGTGKTADITHAVLQHPSLHSHKLDGTPVPGLRNDITYLERWAHQGNDNTPVPGRDLYFNLDQFGGPDAVQRWLKAAATYRTELRRVMATRYSNTMYLEDRIMNTSAALERLDKLRRPAARKVLPSGREGDPPFVDRIAACAAYAGQVFAGLIVEDTSVWATRVRKARIQIAHHDAPYRLTGEVGDHVLAEQIYWLFVMCMLRSCDAPDSVFDAIERHPQIEWLRGQARDRHG